MGNKLNYNLILASNSPRRRELLEMLGFEFEVFPSDCNEDIPFTTPCKYAKDLSFLKANDVFLKKIDIIKNKPIIVIGSDTIVVVDERILGKPKDAKDAKEMLSLLAGRTHKVITGVSIIIGNSDKHLEKTFYDETLVTMYENSSEMIDDYIATKEPMDKAGAYGIQGKGAILIEKIVGDYYNVMGLPIARLYRELGECYEAFRKNN